MDIQFQRSWLNCRLASPDIGYWLAILQVWVIFLFHNFESGWKPTRIGYIVSCRWLRRRRFQCHPTACNSFNFLVVLSASVHQLFKFPSSSKFAPLESKAWVIHDHNHTDTAVVLSISCLTSKNGFCRTGWKLILIFLWVVSVGIIGRYQPLPVLSTGSEKCSTSYWFSLPDSKHCIFQRRICRPLSRP